MMDYIGISLVVGFVLIWAVRGTIFSYDSEQTADCNEPPTLEMICQDCGYKSGRVSVHGESKHERLVECTTCGKRSKIPKGFSHRLRLWYSQKFSNEGDSE